MSRLPQSSLFFFFNDTATTEIYTLSLHDALPISAHGSELHFAVLHLNQMEIRHARKRSEEHTSELQSPDHLVCRLLLEKKKKTTREKPKNRDLRQLPTNHPTSCVQEQHAISHHQR